MSMHNPPHPGEFISAIYLEPFGVSERELAYRARIRTADLEKK